MPHAQWGEACGLSPDSIQSGYIATSENHVQKATRVCWQLRGTTSNCPYYTVNRICHRKIWVSHAVWSDMMSVSNLGDRKRVKKRPMSACYFALWLMLLISNVCCHCIMFCMIGVCFSLQTDWGLSLVSIELLLVFSNVCQAAPLRILSVCSMLSPYLCVAYFLYYLKLNCICLWTGSVYLWYSSD